MRPYSSERGSNMKPCTQCGKCCTNPDYMGSLMATGEDVKRWVREARGDILQWVAQLGPDSNPYGDLWISPRTDLEATRCPFVRKLGNKYHCRIYDTRPQVCRDYVPFAPGSVCE